MPIYDRSVRLLMKDMLTEFQLKPGESFSRQRAIDWFQERYPKIKPGTITAHLSFLSTNSPSRVHHNVTFDDDVLYQIDSRQFRLFNKATDREPIHFPVPPKAKTPPEDDDSDQEESGSFVYESELKNYLSKNLGLIEPGLKVYVDSDGVSGIEYPVGSRRIDILAIDSSGNLVVIELKVSRGYERVVGQLSRYMAWVIRNLADPKQKVRGIIIANEISEDLEMASSLIQNVQLFKYSLSLTLKNVPIQQA